MACPDQFFYPEGFEQSEKGVYLLLISRYLEGIGFGSYIDHFSPEDIGDPQNLFPGLGSCRNFDQYHFPLDKIFFNEIHHLDHTDQFIELFRYLFNDLVVPTSDDRHRRA